MQGDTVRITENRASGHRAQSREAVFPGLWWGAWCNGNPIFLGEHGAVVLIFFLEQTRRQTPSVKSDSAAKKPGWETLLPLK